MTRPSPSEHAKHFPYQIKKGNDNSYNYLSKKDKNGVFKWVKLDSDYPIDIIPVESGSYIKIDDPDSTGNSIIYLAEEVENKIFIWKKIVISLKKNAEDYFKQFPYYTSPPHDINIILSKFDEVKKKLKTIDVHFYYIKWYKMSCTQSEYDYWEDDNYEKKLRDKDYIYISDRQIFFDVRKKESYACFQHSISENKLSKVNKILKLIFVNRTQGITSSSDVLKIYFEEKKIIKIDKEKEKVYATIYFKKNMKEETAVFVSKLNKEIKKFGRVDEYDEIIFNNQMTISFNIELDKVNQFRETFFKVINKKLSMISKISIA